MALVPISRILGKLVEGRCGSIRIFVWSLVEMVHTVYGGKD